MLARPHRAPPLKPEMFDGFDIWIDICLLSILLQDTSLIFEE